MNFATKVDPEDALEMCKYSAFRAFWGEISPLQALLTHGKADSPNPGFDSVVLRGQVCGFLYAQEAQAT